MKKKIMTAALAAILLASGLTGCRSTNTTKIKTRTGKTPETTKETEEPDETEGTDDPGKDQGQKDPPDGSFEIDPDEPLFIMTNTNWAWGFGMSHRVVMGNGDVYVFGSSCQLHPNINTYEEDLEHKLDHMKDFGPSYTLDADYLQSLFDAAYAIDPNADYNYENIMFDYGQNKVELVQTDKADDGVLVYEYGDNELTIDDKNAAKFNELYENFADHITWVNETSYSIYTTEHPIVSYNSGYVNHEIGCYIFNDREEFFKAIDQLGLDRSEFSVFEDPCYEYYPYFLEIDNEPSLGYMCLSDAFLALGNTDFKFLMSEDSYVPDPEDTVCDAMDGFVNAFCYPVNIDVESVVNDDSNEWSYFDFES